MQHPSKTPHADPFRAFAAQPEAAGLYDPEQEKDACGLAAVATLPLVRWTARWPRRRALLLTLVCLTVSQALSVLAPNFAVLSVARVLCALTHGLMWSVLAPIAVRLVPPGHGGRATTAVYAGTALALVAGNPMTALLSQTWGWRTAAAAVMVAAAAVTLAARLLLPVLPATTTGPTGRVSRRRWHRNRALATLCGLTLVGVSAHFMSYTYIAVVIGEVTGTATAPVLAGFGVAGLAAMAVFARPLDRWPRPVLMTALAGLVAAFAGLAFVAGGDPRPVLGVVGMLAWGAMSTALPPMLQSAAITSAPEDPDGASGLYVAMFQAGIVTGALAGGARLPGGDGPGASSRARAAIFGGVIVHGRRGCRRGRWRHGGGGRGNRGHATAAGPPASRDRQARAGSQQAAQA